MHDNTPLSEKLRPRKLSEFVGQAHLVGENGMISKLILSAQEKGYFPSLIFWGPPGCGKTTLARIVSNELNTEFYEFSAVNTSVKDIVNKVHSELSTKCNAQKSLISPAYSDKKNNLLKAPIVFIDEIHRFNKAQQDALLPHVEKGTLILIGATTENPSFEVIGPLLSRTRVILLNALEEDDLSMLARRACKYLGVKLSDDAQEYLISSSNGDARILLNIIEISSHLSDVKDIGIEQLKNALQKSSLNFDLKGEEYYNTISAFHKSIRGSDPNAALYYLARMLEAGQDPLYIARRLIRASTEDIGLADPNALIIAVSAFEACNKLGVPECNLALAEAVVYLAKAPKSNMLYLAYGKAAEDVHNYGNLPVPLHIRNAATKLMKDIGYGKGYDYNHNTKGEKNPDIEYLPDKLRGHKYL